MKPTFKALSIAFTSAVLFGLAAGYASAAPSAPAPGSQPKTDKPADPPKEQPKKDEKSTTTPPAEEKKDLAPFEYVKMSTSKGDIYIELDHTKAPISTENFIKYVDKKFYDGTIFHRVVPGFVIQGGGLTEDMKEKTTEKPIKNEWQNGLKNKRGTLSMARTNAPDSATSQFFVNLVDNQALDTPRDGAAYAVFGKVVKGMDVVDKIAQVKTGDKGRFQNVPTEAVLIKSVTRVSKEEAEKK